MYASVFKHKLDIHPDYIDFASFSHLIDHLVEKQTVPRHPDAKNGVVDPTKPKRINRAGKEVDRYSIFPSTPAICPQIFEKGTTRAKANVRQINWIAVDCDNDHPSIKHTIDSVHNILASKDLQFALFTTTKSRREAQRFRILIAVSRPILPVEWEHVMHIVDSMLGGRPKDRVVDWKTRDLSRLSYVPSDWEGADNEHRLHLEGKPFDVDAMIAQYPYAPPPPPSQVDETELKRVLESIRSRGATPSFDAGTLCEEAQRFYDTTTRGGRFYSAMCSHAFYCLLHGHDISADELEAVALAFDTEPSRPNSKNEARHALRFVQSRFVRQEPLDHADIEARFSIAAKTNFQRTFNPRSVSQKISERHKHDIYKMLCAHAQVAYQHGYCLKVDDLVAAVSKRSSIDEERLCFEAARAMLFIVEQFEVRSKARAAISPLPCTTRT